MTSNQEKRLRPLLKKLVMEVRNELREDSQALTRSSYNKILKIWERTKSVKAIDRYCSELNINPDDFWSGTILQPDPKIIR